MHGEQVTVGHPPDRAPVVGEDELVAASNDRVSGRDLLAPADGELVVGVHESGVDVVLTHEMVDGLAVRVTAGHDQRLGAGGAVVEVRLDCLVDHVGSTTPGDPAALVVHRQAGCVTVTQSKAGLSLFGVALEPHDLIEHGGSGHAGQLPEQPAGFDGIELHRVTDEPDNGAGFARDVGQGVQVFGAGHAGLIDQQHVAGTDRHRQC